MSLPTYIYCSAHDDAEYSTFTTEEHTEHWQSEDCEPRPVELVFSMEGAYRPTIAADFIHAAIAWLCTLPLTDEDEAFLTEARQVADTYVEHGRGSECPEDCTCEWIHDYGQGVEDALYDHGFITEWNTGDVTVWRIGGES